MIEVGTAEHYVAVYRGEMTPEGYRCAVEVSCAGLLGLYEPVWFTSEAIARFMAELEAVIDGRRTTADMETKTQTMPTLAFKVSRLEANYKLAVTIAAAHLSSGLDDGPAVLTISVPHESLLVAFRELRNYLPDLPTVREKAPSAVDLSWDGDNGCRLTLRSFETRYPMADFDCEVAINALTMTLREVAFLGAELQEFVNRIRAIEAGESSQVELHSAGREFKLEIEGRRAGSYWVNVALHVHETSYGDTYEQTLMGSFSIGARVMSTARQTLSELLRVFDSPDEVQS